MSDHDLSTDYDEPFHGFEMTDEQIPDTPFRPVALELKHVFEAMTSQVATTDHAIFLPQQVQDALSEFFWRPSRPALEHILQTSPALHDSIAEITRRVAPLLLRQLPQLT